MDWFIKTFVLIFVAEMGDKTQILALAFATRYSTGKVLLGILLGSALNHGLAVLLGKYISSFVSTSIIQVSTSIVFIVFALWTLWPNYNDVKEENKITRFGPIITVAIAFFLGELGDKTQLTVITLTADGQYPLNVLIGAMLGMVTTGALGIFIGRKLGDRIPEIAIKLIASAIFMVFGISKLVSNLPEEYLISVNISIFLAILLPVVLILLRYNIYGMKKGNETVLKSTVSDLHNYYNQINHDMNCICLGLESCGKCQGNECVVGYTKSLLKRCLNDELSNDISPPVDIIIKQFNKEQALDSLILTLQVLKDDPNYESYKTIDEIRKNLEIIVFGKSISEITSWEEYLEKISKGNDSIAKGLLGNELISICTSENTHIK